MHRLRDIGLLAEAGSLEDLALELEGGLVEVAGEAGMLHELVVTDLEVGRRPVTGVIDEVDGARASGDVDSGAENKEGRTDDDGDEIVLEVEPEVAEIVGVHLGSLDDDHGHERDETEG